MCSILAAIYLETQSPDRTESAASGPPGKRFAPRRLLKIIQREQSSLACLCLRLRQLRRRHLRIQLRNLLLQRARSRNRILGLTRRPTIRKPTPLQLLRSKLPINSMRSLLPSRSTLMLSSRRYWQRPAIPEQIAFADYWVSQNKTLTGTALAQAVDQEPWDASVKGLTQFPTVLHTLASNLTWTSNLGDAFQNQQAGVMAAVQRMRAKAQAAGNLQSNSQIQVVQQTPSTIVIQPANPQVVYVPQYNPAVIYGVPYVVPAYTPPSRSPHSAHGISFDAGVAVGAVIGGGGGFVGGGFGFGWGWGAWGCNWGGGGGTVIFNHNTYINVHNYNAVTIPGDRMDITAPMAATIPIPVIIPAPTRTTDRTAPITPTDITVRMALGTTTFPALIRPISRTAATTATTV